MSFLNRSPSSKIHLASCVFCLRRSDKSFGCSWSYWWARAILPLHVWGRARCAGYRPLPSAESLWSTRTSATKVDVPERKRKPRNTACPMGGFRLRVCQGLLVGRFNQKPRRHISLTQYLVLFHSEPFPTSGPMKFLEPFVCDFSKVKWPPRLADPPE